MTVVNALLLLVPVTASVLSVSLVLLLLLGRDGTRSAAGFVAGWFAGAWLALTVAMLGVVQLERVLGDAAGSGLPPVAEVLLGLAALIVGVIGLRRSRTAGSVGATARLAALAEAMTPPRSLALGFALVALSPRQLLFLAPAGALFASAGLPAGVAWLPAIGAAVATLGVVVPLLVVLVVGRVDDTVLPRLRTWWADRGDLVGAIAVIGVGVVLVALGASRLLA
jgi:hypothetical protein